MGLRIKESRIETFQFAEDNFVSPQMIGVKAIQQAQNKARKQ